MYLNLKKRSVKLLWLTINLFVFLFAFRLSASNLTQEKLDDIKVSITLENVSIKQILDELKTKTDFAFSYTKEVINDDTPITLNYQSERLSNVLLNLAKQANLQFIRIDANISVKKNNKTKKAPDQDRVIDMLDEISGKIRDAKTGEPLIGATIMVAETKIGTAADINGSFTIKVNKGQTLIVSYIGFKTQKVIYDGSLTTLNFSLEEDGVGLEEVIVTSNKKAQSLQDVPASITAVSPEQIRLNGSAEFRDYAASIPNLSFGTKGGNGALNDGRTSNQIAIRGISGSNTTAVYLDETPLPANISPRLVDLARVEVLRGPQGTLYGSSSMGGAVRNITNQPSTDDVEGSLMTNIGIVEEGDVDYVFQGLINIPISDKLAVRAAGFYDFESGVYDRNLIGGDASENVINAEEGVLTENADGEASEIEVEGCDCQTVPTIENIDDEINAGFHASVGYYPSENISIIPKVIYQNQQGKGYDFADISPDNFDNQRAAGLEEFFEDEWIHYSLTADIGLGAGKIVSSTSFTDRYYNEQEDFTDRLLSVGLPWAATIDRGADYTKFVQEVRFQSDLGGDFDFIAGGFFAKDKLEESGGAPTPGLFQWLGLPEALWGENLWNFTNDLDIEEFSFFGEVYYQLSAKIQITAGIRYFDAAVNRQFYGFGLPTDLEEIITDGEVSENGFNPKLNLSYKLSDNNQVYATVSRGFRLGGINDPIPIGFCGDELEALGEASPGQFESDDLWNYEIGYKGTLAQQRMTVNAAVFYNDWTNIQQFRRLSCGFGFTSNAGAARILGLDLEMKGKVTNDLVASVGLGLLDPKITESGEGLEAEDGDQLLFTPSYNLNLSLNYNKTLANDNIIFGFVSFNSVGERFSTFEAQHDIDITDEDAVAEAAFRTLDNYHLMNVRVGMVFSGNYEISIFGNNITGQQANYGDIISLAAEVSGRPRYTTNRPRTIGLQLEYFF